MMALLGNLTVLVDGHTYIPAKMTQNSTLMCQCQLPGFDFILYCVKCQKEMKSFCTIFATSCDFTIIPKFKKMFRNTEELLQSISNSNTFCVNKAWGRKCSIRFPFNKLSSIALFFVYIQMQTR